MKVNVLFNSNRYVIEVGPLHSVAKLKQQLISKVKLNVNILPPEGHAMPKFVIYFHHTPLPDDILLYDIGLIPGSTIHCTQIFKPKSFLKIYIKYSSKFVEIHDDLDPEITTIGELRVMLQNRLGIPVSVFRLIQEKHNQELYDIHPLCYYKIQEGEVLILEIWKGFKPFLLAALREDIVETVANIPSYHEDPSLNRYLLRVGLFIAAHFNYIKLAAVIMQYGIR